MHPDDFQDITDFRLSHSDWHRGEKIITTNYQIYESSIPYDEDFGVGYYYNDETPKTLEVFGIC